MLCAWQVQMLKYHEKIRQVPTNKEQSRKRVTKNIAIQWNQSNNMSMYKEIKKTKGMNGFFKKEREGVQEDFTDQVAI